MKTTWDFDTKNKDGNKADYTKFATGITRLILVDEAPQPRWQHWMNEHKRGVTCMGKGCPICALRKSQKDAGEPVTYTQSMRLAMNVYNIDTEKLEVMDQGKRFMNDLKLIKEEAEAEGKNIRDYIIKVRRTGTTKDDTSYRVDLGDKYELSDVEKGKIAVPNDLSTFFSVPTADQLRALMAGERPEDVFKREDTQEEYGVK